MLPGEVLLAHPVDGEGDVDAGHGHHACSQGVVGANLARSHLAIVITKYRVYYREPDHDTPQISSIT